MILNIFLPKTICEPFSTNFRAFYKKIAKKNSQTYQMSQHTKEVCELLVFVKFQIP